MKYKNEKYFFRHEDGTVKFWNVSGLSFNLLYTISTGKLFESDFDDGPPPDDGEEEDWPPFKKVGSFDPFSDDPRFVIQKIQLCPVTGILVVGGSGGQLLVYDLKSTEERDSTEVINTLDTCSYSGKFVKRVFMIHCTRTSFMFENSNSIC